MHCYLGHANNYAMKVIVGDITAEQTVLEAMNGVDVVIHCAAIIDTSLYPDEVAMKRVNVEGKCALISRAFASRVFNCAGMLVHLYLLGLYRNR